MRRTILLLFGLLAGIQVIAKTTYIPTYKTYIHIVNGSDTSAVSSNLMDLRLHEGNGMFCIYVEHEDVTKEKVKAIKRAKRNAGWAAFYSVMSSISTAFSQNNVQYLIRSKNSEIASQLAEMYYENAKAEQNLLIDL